MGAPDLSEVRASGQCLCGSVKYEVRGPLRAIVECHCRTCRRLTGGLWHATAARRGDVTIDDGGTLRWYRSSPPVRRGFCGNCGSSLFFDGEDRPFLAITAGTLNEPTGIKLGARIFTADAADYYDFSAGIPNVPDRQHGLEIPES